MEADLEIRQKHSSSASTIAPVEPSMPKSPPEKENVLPGHDSMVTVRLSEPPTLSVNTDLPPNTLPTRKSIFGPECTPTTTVLAPTKYDGVVQPAETTIRDSAALSVAESTASAADETDAPVPDDEETPSADDATISDHDGGEESEDEVNWEQLQKTEAEEVKDQDDNSTAMLLARLEQENNKLATNPKSVKVQVVEQPASRRPKPPSMAQLRDIVNSPTPNALRYSVVPPPPMTDLEFYMALVKDYQQTAARLPTLLAKKIRKGIPPPLRGVVWQSMASARDTLLLEQFERLSSETSPYEGLIGKDLGRSFPGVDMFRDPEGDGQRMLARVLKCFSLYDQKIGYCQGLAFLVGPLLMHMPDSQAFCVLVRLMENYDLRSCFLPDLSGLHVRIYQFRELLRQNLPEVSTHLDELEIDPGYVSQWFLSFFAVTCPLPMLFRIYDVVFAEGASETIMRVALSLMRKNESRILGCTELEDVMHLLLSRGLWDCYHYNADEFVDDFVSLSGTVSREKLAQLEQGYREEQMATANATRTSDITTAASRFLGRLWTISSSSPKTTTLSPGLSAPSRPLSMLRRSPSKQSLASTLNSMEASSASVVSNASTDATTASRDSSNADEGSIRESTPTGPRQTTTAKTTDRNLHSQIEDLLMALSDLQRNHAMLATELQKEREERDEDKKAVNSLLHGLKKGKENVPLELPSQEETTEEHKTTGLEPVEEETVERNDEPIPEPSTDDQLSQLIEAVGERFGAEEGHRRRKSSSLQTKSQLRDELTRTKELLTIEMSKSQEYNRRIDDLGSEASKLREQLKDSHAHVRNLVQDKQRLEKSVHSMRVRGSGESTAAATESGSWLAAAAAATNLSTGNGAGAASGGGGGLRELKLGRSKSTPNTQSPFSNRSSTIVRAQTEPTSEQEALVVELVQAKTAEAVARQEADEYKQKLESLRKSYGLAPGDTPPAGGMSSAASTAMGVLGRFTTTITEASSGGAKGSTPAVAVTAAPAANHSSTASSGGGGFWGWRR